MKMFCYKNSTGTVIENIFNVFEKLNKEIKFLLNHQIHPPISESPNKYVTDVI